MSEQTTLSKIHKWMLFLTDPGAKSILFVLNNGGKNGIEALDKRGNFTLILFYLLFSVGNQDMSHLSQSRGGTAKSYFLVPRGNFRQAHAYSNCLPRGRPRGPMSFLGSDLEVAAQQSLCSGAWWQFLHLELQNEVPTRGAKPPNQS